MFVFVFGMCLNALAASAKVTKKFIIYVNSEALMHALIQRENPRRDLNAVGDRHLRNKAYGLLQVRPPYVNEVNRIVGKKEMCRRWGKSKLTAKDMKDPAKAKWVCHRYLSYYGKYYTKKTHKKPTIEVYARIHNGGPIGWKKKSTVKYGKAVVQYAKAYQARRTQKGE